ncbi:MAG: shikimate dehydrogenase [Verrucomicrobiota bacterium]
MKDVYTFNDLQNWESATTGLIPPARLSVFGAPVAHSLSPQMHNPALEAANIESQYTRIEIEPDQLHDALRLLPSKNFIGTNVTIPHKTATLEVMDEVDALARKIGAVNAVVVENDRLIGFNSDGPGFVRAIREEFSVDVGDLRIMILGAGGGAGRAVAVQCAVEKCERLILVNRTAEKAAKLADELQEYFIDERVSGPGDRLKAIPWDDEALQLELDEIDLVVNATSLGMKRTDPDLLHHSLIQPHHLFYDMVYSPPRTKLISSAEAKGARAANGLSMLLWQGAISFEYWFNRSAPVEKMRKGLVDTLPSV